MRDFLIYLRHSLRIMFRNDLWFMLIPIVLLSVVGAWTLYTIETPHDWKPWMAVAQAEALGSLISIFVCAGLLDAEIRHNASEIIFSKPHRPSILLGVRLALAMGMVTGLLLILLSVYHFKYGNAAILPALMCGLPSCLFTGLVALTVGQQTKTAITGIAVSLFYWLWNSTLGMLYNPLLVLTAGIAAGNGGEGMVGVNLWVNKGTLLLLSALLFWLNVRRLARHGGEAGGSRNTGPMRKLIVSTNLSLLALAYFWSGAMAKVVTMEYQPTPMTSNYDWNRRPYRGQTLVGANQVYQMLMAVYGPVPMGPMFGPGADSFLRGIGLGLDPNSPEYERIKRAALERSADTPGLWRNRARLELAAMDALPEMVWWNDPFAHHENEPMWVTVGFADADRWWVSRQGVGHDLSKADDLCAQILRSHPSPVMAAEALNLRARLAGSQWDFPRQEAYLKELVYEYPSMPLAVQAAQELANFPSSTANPGAYLSLIKHVYHHQGMPQSLGLANQVALMQAQTGDVKGGRDTLQEALEGLDRYPKWKPLPGNEDDLRTQLTTALHEIDKQAKNNGGVIPPPAISPVEPGFMVSTRVTAGGKPLPGITIALIPDSMGNALLPSDIAGLWQMGRPLGKRAAAFSQRGRGDSSPEFEWNSFPIEQYLRQHPGQVARSDASGGVSWASVPNGAYAVVAHLGTWEVKEAGRLSPLPPDGPIRVNGTQSVVSEIRFVAPLRVSPLENQGKLPSIKWTAVPGAARYRVALRIKFASSDQNNSTQKTWTIAPPLQEQTLIWWKDVTNETHATVDAANFVGPATDVIHSGLLESPPYAWIVEAFDTEGRPLATSDSLLEPKTYRMNRWEAIQPSKTEKTKQQSAESPREGRWNGPQNVEWTSNPMMPQPGKEYSSPFLDSILVEAGEKKPAAPLLEKKKPEHPSTQMARLPSPVVSNGKGLPARRDLQAMLAASPGGMPPGMVPGGSRPGGMPGGPGMPQNIPPEVLARMRQMQATIPPGSSGMGGGPGFPPPPGSQMGHLPPVGAGGAVVPPQREMSGGPMPPDGMRMPGKMPGGPGIPRSGTMPSSGGGKSQPPGRTPGGPVPSNGKGPVAPSASTGVKVHPLFAFTADSGLSWRRSDDTGNALMVPDAAGLPINASTTLTPEGEPLPMPAEIRRIILYTDGRAMGDLALSDATGAIKRIPITPSAAGKNAVAEIPSGEWSLTALHLAPKDDGKLHLLSLAAEAAPSSGVFALATQKEGNVWLEVRNLNSTEQHLRVFTHEAEGDSPEAVLDVSPGGRSILRYSPSAFGEEAYLQWSGGRIPLPVHR